VRLELLLAFSSPPRAFLALGLFSEVELSMERDRLRCGRFLPEDEVLGVTLFLFGVAAIGSEASAPFCDVRADLSCSRRPSAVSFVTKSSHR
jgi:hypothetical protein